MTAYSSEVPQASGIITEFPPTGGSMYTPKRNRLSSRGSSFARKQPSGQSSAKRLPTGCAFREKQSRPERRNGVRDLARSFRAPKKSARGISFFFRRLQKAGPKNLTFVSFHSSAAARFL